MKNIKILFCLLFVVIFQANVFGLEISKDDLIEKMSKDSDVEMLLFNESKLTYITTFINEKSQLPEDVIITINELKIENKQYYEKVENKFPSFKELNNIDKQAILIAVINIHYEKSGPGSWLNCIKNQLTTACTCMGETIINIKDIHSMVHCFSNAVAMNLAANYSVYDLDTYQLGRVKMEFEFCYKWADKNQPNNISKNPLNDYCTRNLAVAILEICKPLKP